MTPPVDQPESETPWLRLNPLMLIVSPVQELMHYFPVVIAAIIWGASNRGSSGLPLEWIGVALPIVLGIWRYLTTSWRITPTQVQLRRGLISRNILVAPRDRVRSVELTSTLIHRALGLSQVRIGTGETKGHEGGGFELNALPTAQARELRGVLLHRSEEKDAGSISTGSITTGSTDTAPAGTAPADEILLTFDPTWARFAPLTASGLVVLGAIMALAGQVLGPGLNRFDDHDLARLRLGGWALVAAGMAVAVVALIVLPVIGYLIANWGFALTRDGGRRSYHVRRGLFTTLETSLERDRIRGVQFKSSILTRQVGAGSLHAIVSGLESSGTTGSGKAVLAPLSPLAVSSLVTDGMLGEEGLLTRQLIHHGPKAARRRWTRAALTFLPVAAGLSVAIAGFGLWRPLYVVPVLLVAIGAYLALDRYRQLGHAFTGSHLVVASGSLAHERSVIDKDAIIGWNFRQSFFQRRLGITSLDATIAASDGAVTALDLELPAAVGLVVQVSPGLLDPFLAGE